MTRILSPHHPRHIELAEAGQIVLGAEFVRDEWSRVGLDLATDAWVVVDSRWDVWERSLGNHRGS